MTRLLLAFFCIVTLAAATGCNRPVRPLSGFQPAPNPIEIDAAEYDRVFRASIDVLRDAGFRVSRRDYRFGEVTTLPRTSPSVFEPWRGDNTTPRLVAQSTLNHTRRTVRVSLDPITPEDRAALNDLLGAVDPTAPNAGPEIAAPAATEGPGALAPGTPETPSTYRLRLQVDLETLQYPTRRLTMAAHGYRASSLSAVPAEWRGRDITPAYWLNVGRDDLFEQRLIRAIIERSLDLEDAEPVAATTDAP